MTTVAELREALSEMDDDVELYVHVGATPGHATVPFTLQGPANYGPRAALIHCDVQGLTPWGKACPVMAALTKREEGS